MPTRAPPPRLEPGCLATTTARSGRCDEHERAVRSAYERQRGSAARRGYDARWREEQKWVVPDKLLDVLPAVLADSSMMHTTKAQ